MKINLNSASKAELMKLPNVGEKTAIAIIEYRNRKPFNHPSELKNIKGIGDKKYDTMKDFIEVK
ncbi:MAG: helix-hairpin-helix domain-containing protein [Candidatus Kapabacteria bacterium]|nr:helix-hairpin-helix domain-containing protein [Ignavibacteriota bacterium]MCW5885138.1 helix-hairpin-helix domain-containing protein [Candidatus Kapabacteria bacterium]